ncbi:GlxA family transcriptional regulator [Marinobacterium jannaschii]|uniref:GlxA family transcriptional regulator n=1 Tax=Marinobacterium jannaschii TaxID=64970 RepID=UPI000B1D7F0E|nr:GlxA family transcriptional regulator [Marinobacterium jannaschii]
MQKSTPNTTERRPLRYGFVLVPNFSLIGFSTALEPLRMANIVASETLYETLTVSRDGEAVTSSGGVPVQVDHSFDNLPPLDALFVCGASPVARTGNEAVIAWLRKRQKQTIGGIGTGSYLMACAGLLEGHKATIHWGDLESMREEFPTTRLSNNLYEIDGNRFTCGGGTAAMDMMLFLIGQQHDMNLAAQISEQFVCERMRSSEEPQRVPLRSRLGTSQPKLVEAVELMEANLEEPLSSDDLAQLAGVSRRHLERLFKKHLQTVPSQHYLELRLEKARHLLRNSDHPILEVGRLTGFASASYFSTAYRNHYGISPREERRGLKQVQESRDLAPRFGHSRAVRSG